MMKPLLSPPNVLREYYAETLIQSINVWGNVCDRDLNVLVWNPTAERTSGYSREEVIGHSEVWNWLYPDVDMCTYIKNMASRVLVEDGIIHELETQITCKDYSLKTIAWYSVPLIDGDDCIQGFITFGYNVTDRKIAERALQNAHNELHILYEIAALTSEVKDLSLIFERALDHILAAIRSTGGVIYLGDDHSDNMSISMIRGVENDQLPDEAHIRHAFKVGQPLFSEHGDTADQSQQYLSIPMRAKGQVYGVISLLVNRRTEITSDEIALLTSIADQIGIAVENTRLYEQSKQLAVSEDRRRLARDLHDSVTQSLYCLTLFAEAGQRLMRMGDHERVEKYLERLGKTAQDALREMRLLLYELRPLAFHSGELIEAIQQRLDAVERRAGLSAHLITTPLPALAPRLEEGIYHIVLEALNNALKHSHSSVVSVDLSHEGETITLNVNDHGVGFSTIEAQSAGGMGLSNMRERAEELGGTLSIKSSPREGTQVCAKLPTGL
ncbi:MAG: histidine kinase [Anaerolineae bacterium]